MNPVKTSLFIAATALALLALPAHAQDTTTDNETEATASVPAGRIADRYADSLFDGDEDAAADAVKSLRTGGDYTVKNADGTTTTVENTNGPMGYGEVNLALGMAEKQVAGGDADTWQEAMYGTADTTNADGTVTEGSPGILEMRADGMGWGKIAKELGFSLGSVAGKAPKRDDAESTSTTESTSTAKSKSTAKSDRTSKADRTAKTTAKPETARKPERAAKPERATKPERVEKPERVAKPERPERPERVEKPERPDKPERGGRP